jgi:hypothetical protein
MTDDLTRTVEPTGPQPGGAADDPAAAPPGYELLAEVGRGGMGVVYRARETDFNRDVAVKFLRERYPADSPEIRRFLDEARITGQLQHPAIPPVHHLGLLPDGRPFLAMKLIRGRTLEDILKGRANPAEDRGRFLAIFGQVCQAIAHAHNVIHRDLKPANVMVGNFAEVQVMDWRLAKSLTGGRSTEPSAREADETIGTEIRSLRDLDSATQAGDILGTLAYMPPEQAGGEVDKIDARADVFGLGAAPARREAIALAREAVSLDPASAWLRCYLVGLLDANGDLGGALTESTQAARLDPKNAPAHDWVAFLYLRAEKPGAALPFAEKAVELDPNVAQAWWNLGRARQGVGDLDGATAAFREGLKRNENHDGCKAWLAALRKGRLDEALARGDWAAVRDLLAKSIAGAPEEHDAWMQAAAVLAYLGQSKEYGTHRAAMLERFGTTDNPVTAERTAKACLLLPAGGDDLKRAEALAATAAAAGAKGHWIGPYAALAQGLADLRRGRPADAENRLKEALTAKDVEWNVTVAAGLTLAVCQHHRGDAKEAARSLAAAVLVLDRDVPAPADLKEYWHDWLICKVLRREAEARIAPKKP